MFANAKYFQFYRFFSFFMMRSQWFPFSSHMSHRGFTDSPLISFGTQLNCVYFTFFFSSRNDRKKSNMCIQNEIHAYSNILLWLGETPKNYLVTNFASRSIFNSYANDDQIDQWWWRRNFYSLKSRVILDCWKISSQIIISEINKKFRIVRIGRVAAGTHAAHSNEQFHSIGFCIWIDRQ